MADFNDDFTYEFVMERENLKQLDNSSPKSLREFSSAGVEHFCGCKHKHIQKLFLLLVVLLAIYYFYKNTTMLKF